jgi:hypothetical protein
LSEDSTKLFAEALDALFGLVDAQARLLETSANLEKATKVKMTDYSKLWTQKDFISFLTSSLGEQAVGKLAIALVRLSSINLKEASEAPPNERLEIAKTLREISGELRTMLGAIGKGQKST